MSKFVKIIIFSVIAFMTVFVFTGEVFAKLPDGDIKTDNGYALCHYEATKKIKVKLPSSSMTYTVNDNITVYLWAYKQSGKYKTGAYVLQSTEGKTQTDSTIYYYDESINDNEDMGKQLYDSSSNKWKCPDKIYLSGEGSIDSNTTGKFIIHFVNGKFVDGSGYSDISTSIGKQLNSNLDIGLKEAKVKTGSNVTVNFSNIETPPTAEEASKSVVEDKASGNISGEEGTSAASTESIKDWANNKDSGDQELSDDASCNFINEDVRNFLNKIFTYITVGGIILIVIMSAVSGIKVITLGEQEAIRKFFKSIWVRVICLIVLLLLPFIVSFVISTVNNIAKIPGVSSSDPTCGIGSS